MHSSKKIFIICIIHAVLLIASPLALAWQASGCGGCGASYFYTCADRFCDRVDSFSGWGQLFCLGCSSCSQNYYMRSASGGSENSWVDNSDIHFRNSHCTTAYDSFWGMTLSGIPFTDGTVTPGEAYRAWGDYDLEWMACKCCSLLRDSSRAYWYTTFDGLHLMLGYKTSSYGYTDFGKIWANKMKQTTILWWTIPGQTLTQAWFNTTDQTQPSGTVARVLAEVYNNYNDHLWGNGYVSSDPTYNGIYWYWDHTAGSPEYLSVNNLTEMIVYEVVPRTVNQQYVQEIGRAFGLTGEVADACDSLVMANPQNPSQVLQVSKTSGQFYFQDSSRLFFPDPDVKLYPPEMAQRTAGDFLEEYKLLPADAGESTVEFDSIVEEDEKGNQLQRIFQNTNVVWARQIPATPDGRALVSVAGAGARLKVYLAEDGQPMGGMGNWRDIKEVGMIPVNDSEKTWSFFDHFGERIAVTAAQVQYDQAKPNFETAKQGYYELPGMQSQSQLIPCWIFEVQYFMEGELITEADTFIPAAEGYFPPVVTITKPKDGESFNYGSTIGFDCIVQEGFGTPPYAYQWESSVDGPLSTQKSFDTRMLSVNCPDRSCDCLPLPHVITVTVTDSKGSQSSDSILITILGECDECKDCSDINEDNVTDLGDFIIVAERWLKQSIPSAE